MSRKVNVQKGKQGFQKTVHTAAAPTAGAPSFTDALSGVPRQKETGTDYSALAEKMAGLRPAAPAAVAPEVSLPSYGSLSASIEKLSLWRRDDIGGGIVARISDDSWKHAGANRVPSGSPVSVFF